MLLVALTCEVLARPVYAAAAHSNNVVDVRLNPRGLHDNPADLRTRLQQMVDAVLPPHDAVVLAYGLCGGALAGLCAGSVPLVVPRAHDCITLFLGDRHRYQAETATCPGTYWYVQDYMERGSPDGAIAGLGAASDEAARAAHAEYVRLYGEDNADYLMEALGAWRTHYDRATFIDIGIGDSREARERAHQEAAARAWSFTSIRGSLSLVRGLLEGDWDTADFLTVQPRQEIAMSHDGDVVCAVATDRSSS